jgi:hypothetical protein
MEILKISNIQSNLEHKGIKPEKSNTQDSKYIIELLQ